MTRHDHRRRQLACRIGWITSFIVACILPATSQAEDPVPVYGYTVTDQRPQPRANFVQGLEIVDDHLYVSTGQYGKSQLLRYRLSDAELLTGRQVDRRLFAEGLTIMGERIYQLTWRSRLMLIYNKADLQGLAYFRIPGEGWGLTHNDESLIYSDGSHRLHFLDPTSKQITHSLQVTEQGKPVQRLNELEWIDGEIWANIWQTDHIVIINPATGKVRARIDLSGLLPQKDRRPDTDVLNGIARNPADGSIWVTGKYWPWIYQIEIVIPQSALPKQEAATDVNSR